MLAMRTGPNFVLTTLTGRGFGPRAADPVIGNGAESGCRRLGPGWWGCEALKLL